MQREKSVVGWADWFLGFVIIGLPLLIQFGLGTVIDANRAVLPAGLVLPFVYTWATAIASRDDRERKS
jgi:hypothetical protein